MPPPSCALTACTQGALAHVRASPASCCPLCFNNAVQCLLRVLHPPARSLHIHPGNQVVPRCYRSRYASVETETERGRWVAADAVVACPRPDSNFPAGRLKMRLMVMQGAKKRGLTRAERQGSVFAIGAAIKHLPPFYLLHRLATAPAATAVADYLTPRNPHSFFQVCAAAPRMVEC